MSRFLQAILSLVVIASASFIYLYELNELTRRRLEVPKIEKELKILQEEIATLTFEIERAESPEKMEELLKNPDFPTLVMPKEDEILYR